MAAIGEVDEANAAIGVAIAALGDGPIADQLLRDPERPVRPRRRRRDARATLEGALRIVAAQVERLEREIDAMNAALRRSTASSFPAARRRRRAPPRPRRSSAAPSGPRSRSTKPSRSTRSARLSQPPVGPSVRRRALRRVRTKAATCLWTAGRDAATSRRRNISRTLCFSGAVSWQGRRDGDAAQSRPAGDLASRLFATRKLTLDLAAPLSDADATIQPFPDASPAKWHLAHTTWFFETFVLRDHVPGYRPFDERYAFLFNSYYEAEGPRHARPAARHASRPSLDEVRAYRAHVDEALDRALPHLPPAALELIELGINHEQQHQELLLTDILATLRGEPARAGLWRAIRPGLLRDRAAELASRPRRHWSRSARATAASRSTANGRAIASSSVGTSWPSRRVTNGEWREFIADGGYKTPTLWLSEGWDWVQQRAHQAPLYWHDDGTRVHPWRPCAKSMPPRRSPTSAITRPTPSPAGPARGFRPRPNGRTSRPQPTRTIGNQLDEAGAVVPRPGGGIFGDVWEWTRSAFAPSPASRPPPARSANIMASSCAGSSC